MNRKLHCLACVYAALAALSTVSYARTPTVTRPPVVIAPAPPSTLFCPKGDPSPLPSSRLMVIPRARGARAGVIPIPTTWTERPMLIPTQYQGRIVLCDRPRTRAR